jgi:hypothetical protein
MKALRLIFLAAFLCVSFAPVTVFAQDAPTEPAAEETAPAAPEAPTEAPAEEPEASAEEPAAEEPAAEITADSPAVVRLLDHLLEIAATLLMLVMTWAGMKAKTWFSEKTKIEIPAAIDAQLMRVASMATGFAESKARKLLADNQEKMKGPDKLDTALKFGLDLAEAQNLPKWSKDKLEDYIEAKLGLDKMSEEG